MSIFDNDNVQYSVNNRKCIGPCSAPGVQYVHPITLDIIQDEKYTTCPTAPYNIVDENGENVTMYHDICSSGFGKEKHASHFSNYVTPQIDFDPKYFLKTYYGLTSFDEGLDWIDGNEELNYITKERVFDMLMIVYGKELNVADHRFLNHIQGIMMHNIDTITDAVGKYISIDSNDNITYIDNNSDIDTDNNKKVSEFIKKSMLNDDEIAKFNSKIIRYHGDTLYNVEYVSHSLVEYMIDYIIKRIKITYQSS